jgi:hypothetical protein
VVTFFQKILKAEVLLTIVLSALSVADGIRGDRSQTAPEIPNRTSFDLRCVITLSNLYRRSFRKGNLIPWRRFEHGPNAAENVYKYYLETRSGQLGPLSEARARVEGAAFVPNFELGEETNGAIRYSREEPRPWRILIFIPERYAGTPIEYLIRIHELEHLISGWDNQAALKKAAGESDFVYLLDVQRAKFAIEHATLRAEWEYLQLLPEATRRKMIEKLRADPTMSERQKELFIDKFARALQSFDEFLLSQQRHHGYAGDQMVDHFHKVVVGVGYFPANPPEEKFYNVYKDLPEARRRSLWARIQRDTLFEAEDRARLLSMLAWFESIRKYEPSLDLRITANAEDIGSELSEEIHLWFRKSREFPENLPHFEEWHRILEPSIQGETAHLRAIPSLPDLFVLSALNRLIARHANLREIHLPPTVNSNPTLDEQLSALLRRHGYAKKQQADGLTYIFSEGGLPPWNHRYYEGAPERFDHFSESFPQ